MRTGEYFQQDNRFNIQKRFLNFKKTVDLKNKNILITSGPTIEMWDTIRYLSNMSSGILGLKMAEIASLLGANVTLITSIEYKNCGFKYIRIKSALDMLEAVKSEIEQNDVFISAAAVADYRPVRIGEKIRKNGDIPVINLEKNPDILCWASKNYPKKKYIGFALDDKIDTERALRKKRGKGCHVMIVNSADNMNNEKRTFILISDKEKIKYENIDVDKAAQVIIDQCQILLKAD